MVEVTERRSSRSRAKSASVNDVRGEGIFEEYSAYPEVVDDDMGIVGIVLRL